MLSRDKNVLWNRDVNNTARCRKYRTHWVFWPDCLEWYAGSSA